MLAVRQHTPQPQASHQGPGSPFQSPGHHIPLASLPLLLLPGAAAAEVQHLFDAMLEECSQGSDTQPQSTQQTRDSHVGPDAGTPATGSGVGHVTAGGEGAASGSCHGSTLQPSNPEPSPSTPGVLRHYPADLIAVVYNQHFAGFVEDLAVVLFGPANGAQQESAALVEGDMALRDAGMAPTTRAALQEIAGALVLFLAQHAMLACLQVRSVTECTLRCTS
jgi:hypothetical protein